MKGVWQCSVRRGIYPVYPPSRIFLTLPFQGFNLVSCSRFCCSRLWFSKLSCSDEGSVLYKAGVICMNLMTRLSDAIPEPGRYVCSHSNSIIMLTWKVKCFLHFQVWHCGVSMLPHPFLGLQCKVFTLSTVQWQQVLFQFLKRHDAQMKGIWKWSLNCKVLFKISNLKFFKLWMRAVCTQQV